MAIYITMEHIYKPKNWLLLFCNTYIAMMFVGLNTIMAQDERGSYLINKIEVEKAIKDLSEEELKIFKEETRKKIDQLQSQFSKIASRTESNAVKRIYIKQTLKLFLNEGRRVTIEVSSLTTNRIREFEIPRYLDRLSNLQQYQEVIMKRADACILSDFYEAGLDDNNNKIYKATATIYQEFIGKDERGKVIYSDLTTRTFEITLKLVPTVLDDSGYRWIALLGDVKVAGTIPN